MQDQQRPSFSGGSDHVALFLTEICISAMEKGTGVSVLEATVYSIRWAHQIAGLIPSSDHPLSCLEGAKRKLARPVLAKEPLSLALAARQESVKVREVIPHIGPIPIVIPLKLFLDLLRDPVFPRGLTG